MLQKVVHIKSDLEREGQENIPLTFTLPYTWPIIAWSGFADQTVCLRQEQKLLDSNPESWQGTCHFIKESITS